MDNIKLRRTVVSQEFDLNTLESGESPVVASPSNAIGADDNKKSPRNIFVVPFLVMIWYGSALFAITTSKKTLNLLPLPFLLCTSQFLTASVITSIILAFSKSPPSIAPSSRSIIFQISLSYTMGFVFTNVAFSMVNASFAETIKSAEPLSSVFLGYFFFNEGTSMMTYFTLLPICIGVGISCIDDVSFHLLGFLSAAASNFCFSSRAVLTKHMFKFNPQSMDETTLFSYISQIGTSLLIPMVVLLEGHKVWEHFFNTPGGGSTGVLLLMLANGAAYTTYNLVSFLVLSRTDLVTHAVLNVFRRVVIILFTSYYFSVPMSTLNLFGVGLAVGGVLLFGFSKTRDNALKQLTSMRSGVGEIVKNDSE